MIGTELPQITESARQAQRIAGLRISQLRNSRVGSMASFASSMGFEKTSSMLSVISGLGEGTRTTSGSQQLSFGASARLPKQSTKGPK